jgi:chemotaxis protein MotA
MSYLNLIDGQSAAIVVGGTVLGTVLRCGFKNSAMAIGGLAGSLRPHFNASRARSELALQVQEIHRDGLLRAEPRHFGDEEFDEMTDTMIGRRSGSALLEKHRTHKHARLARSRIAVQTFNQAADLAPVFGLAGTLIALSQLTANAAPGTLISSSIPMAIITTFYGLMTAHLLFAPLARFIERKAEKEEAERQKLVDWLASELERETTRQGFPREHLAA